MKKIFMILIGIIVLAVIGAAIFVATLDLNQYKGLITEQIQKYTASRVELGKLGLGWENGPALHVQSIQLFSSSNTSMNPDMELGVLAVNVDFSALLRREIIVQKIHAKDLSIHILRGIDGAIEIKGIKLPASSETSIPSTQNNSGSGSSTMSLTIRELALKNAKIRFTDQNPEFPVDLTVANLSIYLKNLSLSGTADLEASASLFSSEDNLKLKASFTLPQAQKAATLKNTTAWISLQSLNRSKLMESMPKIKDSLLGDTLAGTLEISVPYLSTDNVLSDKTEILFRLNDGAVSFKNLDPVFQNVTVEASLKNNEVIKKFSSDFAGGKLAGSAQVFLKSASAAANLLKFEAQKIKLEEFVKNRVRPGDPLLQGDLSAGFEGAFKGLSQDEITKTLVGNGQITADNLLIQNFNLLREIFAKFSVVPGLLNSLEKHLPEDMKTRLVDSETRFSPVSASVAVQDGNIFLGAFGISTQDLILQAPGARLGLDGAFETQAMVRVAPAFSKAAVETANPVKYFLNTNQEIELKADIQRFPNGKIDFKPDLGQVAQNVINEKAQDLLGKLFEKNKPETQNPDSQTAGQTNTQEEDPLAKLLRKL